MSEASEQLKSDDTLACLRQDIADDLLTLAILHDAEISAESVRQLKAVHFPDGLALKLESVRGGEALQITGYAVERLPDSNDQGALDAFVVDYADIYLTHKLRASPFESVWLDEDGLIMQEPMFQVREWYQRYGLAAKNWRERTDDHLVLQLEFVAYLLKTGDDVEHLAETAHFLDEHLLRWITPFAERVASRCATPFYAGLAVLTAAYLDELRDLIAQLLDKPRPSFEEIEERMKPKQVTSEFYDIPVASVPANTPSW